MAVYEKYTLFIVFVVPKQEGIFVEVKVSEVAPRLEYPPAGEQKLFACRVAGEQGLSLVGELGEDKHN
jgi:hypothetical protein